MIVADDTPDEYALLAAETAGGATGLVISGWQPIVAIPIAASTNAIAIAIVDVCFIFSSDKFEMIMYCNCRARIHNSAAPHDFFLNNPDAVRSINGC